jgi:hypothetical protein
MRYLRKGRGHVAVCCVTGRGHVRVGVFVSLLGFLFQFECVYLGCLWCLGDLPPPLPPIPLPPQP